jgi:hypothetical protein
LFHFTNAATKNAQEKSEKNGNADIGILIFNLSLLVISLSHFLWETEKRKKNKKRTTEHGEAFVIFSVVEQRIGIF